MTSRRVRAHPILFVGYGLADDDFDQMLAVTRALAGAAPRADVPGILRSIP